MVLLRSPGLAARKSGPTPVSPALATKPAVWRVMSAMVIGRLGATSVGAPASVPREDLHVREFGEILRERIVELELPLLPELHHRDAGDRLGHREDLRDDVARHRPVGLAVGHAERAEVDFAALLPDERRRAGDAAGIDVGAQGGVDAALGGRGDDLIGARAGRGGLRGRRRRRCAGLEQREGEKREECARHAGGDEGERGRREWRVVSCEFGVTASRAALAVTHHP